MQTLIRLGLDNYTVNTMSESIDVSYFNVVVSAVCSVFDFHFCLFSVPQGSLNGLSGPSWWWWPSASQVDWCSCMSNAKSTSIYGGDSRLTTGSYTSRTGQTRVKSWRWRSRHSWSRVWRTRKLWFPPSLTQTPPSTQRQRTTVWRCSMSDHSVHAKRCCT